MKKKHLIIYLLLVSIAIVIGYKTYSYYYGDLKVNVTSSGSNIVCDATISNVDSSEASKLGYTEFKVTVKNYDSSDNVSNESFSYTLSITNQDGSNGVFGYNNTFSTPLEINDTLSSSTKDEKEYIIQVKSNDGTSKTINYNVDLNCVQSNS